MVNKNISCVITTHNRDEYLKDAVKSAIEQSYPPIEIVIVNNIPNSKTRNIVNKIADETSVPINYIEHSMNGNGSVSANLAASVVKGDYIAFLMDDDMWEKNYLEKVGFLSFSTTPSFGGGEF